MPMGPGTLILYLALFDNDSMSVIHLPIYSNSSDRVVSNDGRFSSSAAL